MTQQERAREILAGKLEFGNLQQIKALAILRKVQEIKETISQWDELEILEALEHDCGDGWSY